MSGMTKEYFVELRWQLMNDEKAIVRRRRELEEEYIRKYSPFKQGDPVYYLGYSGRLRQPGFVSTVLADSDGSFKVRTVHANDDGSISSRWQVETHVSEEYFIKREV